MISQGLPALTIGLTSKTKFFPLYFEESWKIIKNIDDFNDENLKHIIDLAKHTGIKNLKIIGSDPFDVPNLLEVLLREIGYAQESFDSIKIHTFGIISIPQNLLNLMQKCMARLELFFHLDTIEEETYRDIYAKDKLSVVKENIAKCVNNQLKVTIVTTLMKSNVDELGRIIEFSKNNKCNLIIQDLKSVIKDADGKPYYCEIDPNIKNITKGLDPAGIITEPGGFGIPIERWRMAYDSYLGIRRQSSGIRFAPACAFTTCSCIDGGFPILVTPENNIHICTEDKFIIPLGENHKNTLNKILNGFFGPWESHKKYHVGSGRKVGMPTGTTLKELCLPMKDQLEETEKFTDAIDLRLNERYRILRRGFWRRLFGYKMDPWQISYLEVKKSEPELQSKWPTQTMSHRGLWLKPREMLYGVSCEKISIPRGYIGLVIGRACWSRIGLSASTDISKLQAGRIGNIQLQIRNITPVPIRILPHMYVAQLILFPISDDYSQAPERYLTEKVLAPVEQFGLEREILPAVKYAIKATEKERPDTTNDKLINAIESDELELIKRAEILKILKKPKEKRMFSRNVTLFIMVAIFALLPGFFAVITKWPPIAVDSDKFGNVNWLLMIIPSILLILIIIGTVSWFRFRYREPEK